MGARKQSGCVVFRYDRNFNYEVLLVTSSDGKDWVFPKGGVEKHLSPKESAAKEVYEEAGVEGSILNTLGKYEYDKQGKRQKVVMYAMLYKGDTHDWPERNLRKRKWVSLKKAKKQVPKLLRFLLDELSESNMLALSSSGLMDDVVAHLRTLPVLQESAEITLNEEDQTVSVIVNSGNDRQLFITVENWEVHPLSQKLNIHYTYTHEGKQAKHTKHASFATFVGKVGRIVGRFLSGSL